MAEPTQWALQQAIDFWGVSHRQLALMLDAAHQQGYREGVRAAAKMCNLLIFPTDGELIRERIRALTPEDKTP